MNGRKAKAIRAKAKDEIKRDEYKYFVVSDPFRIFKRVNSSLKKMYNAGKLDI